MECGHSWKLGLFECGHSWNWRLFGGVWTFTKLKTVWWSVDIYEIEECLVDCGHLWKLGLFGRVWTFMKVRPVWSSVDIHESLDCLVECGHSWSWGLLGGGVIQTFMKLGTFRLCGHSWDWGLFSGLWTFMKISYVQLSVDIRIGGRRLIESLKWMKENTSVCGYAYVCKGMSEEFEQVEDSMQRGHSWNGRPFWIETLDILCIGEERSMI